MRARKTKQSLKKRNLINTTSKRSHNKHLFLTIRANFLFSNNYHEPLGILLKKIKIFSS